MAGPWRALRLVSDDGQHLVAELVGDVLLDLEQLGPTAEGGDEEERTDMEE